MGRFALRGLLVVGAIALASCHGCGLQGDPGVKVVVPAMPTTLDWSTSDETSWPNYPVMLATQKGLTEVRSDGSIGPCLAKSWDVSVTPEGHQRYVFHLRDDVKWSDGSTPLVAEDFVFAWQRALRGKERGELSELLGAKEVLDELARGGAGSGELGVRAVDAHTLEVVLDSPRSYFLARLANVYLFFPAPSALLAGKPQSEIAKYSERPAQGQPLSLGPFTVESWDRAGERLTLRRNPHSAFLPQLSADEQPVERVTLLKSEVGDALFARGRVGFVTVDNAAALRRLSLSTVKREELFSTYFLAFNTRRAPLDDVEVRRLIAQSIDREALLKDVLPASRPASRFLPPGLPLSGTAQLPGFMPDARARLAALPKLRPLRLIYRGGESFVPEVAIAERIRSQLALAGVQVELEPRYDFSQEIGRLGPDGVETYDLYLKRIGGDYAHPKTFFVFFERGGNHHTGWERLDGGRLMSAFESELSQGDAAVGDAGSHYARAEEILVGQAAVIAPLYYPDRYYRVREDLVGLGVDRFNFLSLANLRARATR